MFKEACQNGDLKEFNRLFSRMDIETATHIGLVEAAKNGKWDLVILLIERGARLNARSNYCFNQYPVYSNFYLDVAKLRALKPRGSDIAQLLSGFGVRSGIASTFGEFYIV
jgi:hypothetical protein